MDSEKNRKKNKKKKNKQNKAKEDTLLIGEEKVLSDHHHSTEQDAAPSQVSEKEFVPGDISGTLNGENGDATISDAERNGNSINDGEALVKAESERKNWLQKEAMLEETVNQLQSEKDTHMRKGARLEMRVVELEHENESLLLKQASMEGTISQLVSEKTNAIAKQVNLEERIGQLIEEKILMSSKHAEYEERISHLERDKDIWVSKEAKLKETIKNLEADKETWSLKQTSNEEMICRLREDNARLQNQVEELEESKIKIVQEKQMLLENISGLQIQLQNGDASTHNKNVQENSEIIVLNSQIEAASNLIEKLVTENADLVEKVNELFTELDRLGTLSKIGSTQSILPYSDSSVAISDGTVSDTADEINKSLQMDRTESTDIYPVRAPSKPLHKGEIQSSSVADGPNTTDSGEIVQIPLSESESQDVQGQTTADEDEYEDSPVELSDAPLTGAPIRFISFVARYVSGADLVSKNPTNSRK